MKVEENNVFFDPEFVLEQVAKAPREFDVQARNPANTVRIGGDHMAFGAVYGAPFVREGDVRRDATLDDFHRFCKLSQVFGEMDSAGEWSASRTTPRSTPGTSTWSTRSRR
nr:hypothetical protein GCM10020093_105160 [Planobispora longispora]